MSTAGKNLAEESWRGLYPFASNWLEVARGRIDHALRVTVRRTRRAYVHPARHFASRLDDDTLPRMGERLRLRPDFDVSDFPPHARAILTARRRMVAKYVDAPETPRPSPYGIDVVSPLEATPRVATSGPGDARDGGARRHKGLDITASIGEPVRSIADGKVIFAGVSAPGHLRKGPIPPSEIKRYANRRLAVGGIYLCIEHTPPPAEDFFRREQ